MTPAMKKISEFHHLLGIKFDHEIALMAGVADSTVLLYRKKHGIKGKRGGWTIGGGKAKQARKFHGMLCDRGCGLPVVEKWRGEHLCEECFLGPMEPIELKTHFQSALADF